MGHRLSKIYTRTGDQGSTGLGDGSRTSKDSQRVETFGEVDELNSHLGVVLNFDLPEELVKILTAIQHDLFDLGGELCIPGHKTLQASHVSRLEQQLDHLNERLAALKEFILPGGSPAAAACHVARTVCRRAERRLVSLARQEEISPISLQYLNRLSDLLFVLAREINRSQGIPDVLWEPGRNTRNQT